MFCKCRRGESSLNIYNVSKTNQSTRLAPTDRQTLKAGQIIEGKILKLYPENKAEIQLGTQRLVANLEVGLEVGSKYHFQVQSTSDVIQLKVLSQALTNTGEVDLSKLLQQLGIRESKANVRLLDQLLRLKIPFDSSQLTQATEMLKNTRSKSAAIDVLSHMIDRKLPFNTSVFNALFEVSRTSITDQMKAVIQQMNHSNEVPLLNNQKSIEVNLQRAMEALTEKPQTFQTRLSNEVTTQNIANNQGVFRTLQGLGMLPLQVDYLAWKSDQSTLRLNTQEIAQALSKIELQSTAFIQALQNFSNKWSQQLNFHQLLNSSLPEQDFTSLKEMLTKEILPLIQDGGKNHLQQMTNVPSNLSALYQGVQAILQGNDLENLMQLLQKSVADERFLAMPPRQQFLQQTSQFIQSLGLDYEQQILQQIEANKQVDSIKGMLLQLASGAEGKQSETNARLVNLINGMQIQSVNESQTVIQAAIQIPAERLGLIKDMELEFEGKKNENGEINPDYCRILFYLNLGALKETVIDMNIHQRKVAITIFNNKQEIKSVANLFKGKLESNIEALNYQLGSIQYKRIEEKEKMISPVEQKYKESPNQGVDYRI